MEEVIFDNNEFTTVVNGVQVYGDNATFVLIKGDKTVDEIVDAITNVKIIRVVNSDGETLSSYSGYTKFQSAEFLKDYQISYTPASFDDDGNVTADEVVETADVVTVTLKRPTLENRVDKNTADIEYVAIMTDVELD